MSLRIQVDDVSEVLLADGWHKVKDKSFDLDAYEFIGSGDYLIHGGGDSGVCSTGFEFKDERGLKHFGPLTAILAVRTEYYGA